MRNQTSSNNKERENATPKDALGIVTGLLPVLAVLGALVKGLFPSIALSDTAVTGLLTLGAVALISAGGLARIRLDAPTPKYIPFPATLWRLVFNRVRTQTGKGYSVSTRVRVAIIHDSSTRATATQIKDQHLDPSVEITLTEFDPTDEHPENTLVPILKAADAVYFFWTRQIRANSRIAHILNSWALAETDKPVLIVNMIPKETYDLKFNHVPPEDAVAGLWRLLLRANERARLWTEQSLEYRRWWAWTSAVFVIVILALVFWIRKTTAELTETEKRDQVDQGEFNSLAETLLSTRKGLDATQWQSATANVVRLNNVLSHLADFVASAIDRNSAAGPDRKSQISIFRSDGNKTLVQVAWSGRRTPNNFPLDRDSIVSCSVVEKAFVMWSENCNVGAPAAWDPDGRTIGQCAGDDKIRLLSNNATCSYKHLEGPDPVDHRRGLLCFSPEVRDGDNSLADTAVCLDTPRNPHFLTQPWVRTRLEMLALAANSIPTSALTAPRVQIASQPEGGHP